MFNANNKPKGKTAEIVSGELNIIGVGTSITGDIKSNGDLRIDGTISGTVTSKARIVLGPNGKIEGDIFAQNADLQGTVTGSVQVTEILYLKATAVVKGDIFASKLVVESGAQFNGRCEMGKMIRTEAEPITANEPKTAKIAQQL